MVLEAAAQALEKVGAERVARPDYKVRGVHLDALLAPAKVRAFAQAIRSLGFLIEDVTAVDATPDLMLVYHFAHPDECCRVIGRTLVSRESPAVASIHDIFPGANWHERETHDFYGVVFEGHPDLSPLILPEDSGDLRPLRKAEGELKALGAVVPEFAPATEGQVPRAPGMERERPPPKAEGEAAEAEKPVRPKRERPAPATEGQVPRAQDAQERSKAEGEA